MPDITMCKGEGCIFRNECQRYTRELRSDHEKRLTSERDRYRDALEQVKQDLMNGMIVCRRCGNEEVLSDCDMMKTVTEALLEGAGEK